MACGREERTRHDALGKPQHHTCPPSHRCPTFYVNTAYCAAHSTPSDARVTVGSAFYTISLAPSVHAIQVLLHRNARPMTFPHHTDLYLPLDHYTFSWDLLGVPYQICGPEEAETDFLGRRTQDAWPSRRSVGPFFHQHHTRSMLRLCAEITAVLCKLTFSPVHVGHAVVLVATHMPWQSALRGSFMLLKRRAHLADRFIAPSVNDTRFANPFRPSWFAPSSWYWSRLAFYCRSYTYSFTCQLHT